MMKNIKRKLPDGPLIVSYVTRECSAEKIIREVAAGVNVLVWFQSDLLKDEVTRLVGLTWPSLAILIFYYLAGIFSWYSCLSFTKSFLCYLFTAVCRVQVGH